LDPEGHKLVAERILGLLSGKNIVGAGFVRRNDQAAIAVWFARVGSARR